MDAGPDLPLPTPLIGSVAPEKDNIKTMWAPTTVQETWLGAGGCAGDDVGGLGADDGFLGSLEAGGALVSAGGGWSLSTLPGEEGLRWTGAVKTEQEVFDEWAGVGGGVSLQQQAILHPSPLLGTGAAVAQAAATAGSVGDGSNARVTTLAKSDAEEGWKSFVDPAPAILASSKDPKRLDGETDIAAINTPSTSGTAAPPGMNLAGWVRELSLVVVFRSCSCTSECARLDGLSFHLDKSCTSCRGELKRVEWGM